MEGNIVLFVDDEVNVISAIRRGVAEEPYLSLFAGSGREALELMDKRNISVLVTDMRMPGMDGLSLLKIAKEKHPRTVRVVLSGYTQLSQMLATINQGEIFKFIAKPWTSEQDLLPAVRQAVEYYNLQAERDTLRDNLARRNAAYQKILVAMEQKLVEEREELQRLKEISGWIFSSWRKYLSSTAAGAGASQPQLAQFVDEIEAVYLTYLSQLPTVLETKTIARLAQDIAQSCNNRLAINNLSGADFKLHGNHKLLAMIFRILLHNVREQDEKVACDLTEYRRDGHKTSLVFVIDLSPLPLGDTAQSRLRIACALLSRMGKLYNAGVEQEESGEEISHIRIVWEGSEV